MTDPEKEINKELNMTTRPPEKKDDYWLGNSPARENVALLLGHMIQDLLKKDNSLVIKIQQDVFPEKRLHFRVSSVGFYHAARDFKPAEMWAITHPRAQAQRESDDLYRLLETVKSDVLRRGYGGGTQSIRKDPFADYVDHGEQD